MKLLKLTGTIACEPQLRERLDSTWQNTGVLSAFVAAIAVPFLFVDAPLPDEDDDEYDTKKSAKSAFFIVAAATTVMLILSVALTVTNLITLLVCPTDFVDDFLNHLGALEGIPSTLMVVSVIALVGMVPMWAFVNFGSGVEFTATLLVAIAAIVFGLSWQIYMMSLQNSLLDSWMAANKSVSSKKSIKETASPVIEMGDVFPAGH